MVLSTMAASGTRNLTKLGAVSVFFDTVDNVGLLCLHWVGPLDGPNFRTAVYLHLSNHFECEPSWNTNGPGRKK